MAHCFPTNDDVELLVRYINDSVLSLKAASASHRLCDAASMPGDDGDDDNVIASVSRCDGDDDDDVSEALRRTCTGILGVTDTASKFFSLADNGPVVTPARFAQTTVAQLVQLNNQAKQLQKELLAEGREHGLLFSPEPTKHAYGRFSDAIYSVVQWTSSALRFAEGRGDRDGRPVAEKETVHDVSSIYNAFYENSQLYFVQECTLFDPRIQRRILMPAYFHALRDHLRTLRHEIDRLYSLDEVLQRSTSSGAARFNPPVQDFVYLLESLQFYLAVSIVEDDLTTVTYYRILYESVKRETQAVAERLAQLPTEAPAAPPAPAAASSPRLGDFAGADHAGGSNLSPARSMLSSGAPGTMPPSPLRATPSPHEQCSAAFAAFDEVRHRVMELQASIRRDIEAKNQTHKTRAPGVTLQPKGQTASASRQQLPSPQPQPAAATGGWWSSIKAASGKLLCGAADVVTCRAEFFPAEADADGVPLSATSPLAAKKLELLAHVDLLVAAVEAIADGLEQQYPNVYHRDFFSRLQKSATRVIQQLESMTVVFREAI